ncbi:DMT family transporter [Pontibacter sp. SGAir0037]|uniref:EamA family transporter n=1 Tax=Pontibacter sp. SGAir0037 TaxID=2571030 RepID=UPI0010CD23FD|nr:DMT family transporter [Pontibacter sp. SGAir0037]QCR21321.1 EamA family transporter [Pontibacter sp. SGAir0037]
MFRGILLVFLGACSFGILSTFVKLAYKEGFSLGEVTGSQVFFGAVVLWSVVLLRQVVRKAPKKVKAKDALKLVAMGTSTGLVSLLYYKCVQTVPASIAILLLMQFTWMSLVLESIRKKKLPSAIQLLTVLFILAGTVLAGRVFSAGAEDYDLAGIVYGLLAGFSYALFLLINNAAGNHLHPTTKSALLLTGACVLIFSVFPPVFLTSGALANGLFKWGILLSLFGTVIPPLFFAYGIPHTGLGLGAILSAAELPVAVLMSSIILQEQVSLLQWTGVAVILTAIVVSNYYTMLRNKTALQHREA